MYRNILVFLGLSASLLALAGCVAAPVLLLGAAGGSAVVVSGSSEAVPQQGNDVAIKAQVFKDIDALPGLQSANVEVTVFNGIVLLLGQVPTQDLKSILAREVSQIQGVAIVYDQTTVGANLSFGQFANDAWLTSKVKARMTGNVNPLHFKIVTQSGVVYLLGQVTEVEGDEAALIASQTAGVTYVVKIFNYIAAPATATPTAVSAQAQDQTAPVEISPAIATPLRNTDPVSPAPANQIVPGPEQSVGDRPRPGPSASD